MSPVYIQPFFSVSSVAAGLFQYPDMRAPPRQTISPTSAGGRRRAVRAQHRDFHAGPRIANEPSIASSVVVVVGAAQTGECHRRLTLAVDLGEHRSDAAIAFFRLSTTSGPPP